MWLGKTTTWLSFPNYRLLDISLPSSRLDNLCWIVMAPNMPKVKLLDVSSIIGSGL